MSYRLNSDIFFPAASPISLAHNFVCSARKTKNGEHYVRVYLTRVPYELESGFSIVYNLAAAQNFQSIKKLHANFMLRQLMYAMENSKTLANSE
jgi:hypothetical protein